MACGIGNPLVPQRVCQDDVFLTWLIDHHNQVRIKQFKSAGKTGFSQLHFAIDSGMKGSREKYQYAQNGHYRFNKQANRFKSIRFQV
jgi:hypothetical protein